MVAGSLLLAGDLLGYVALESSLPDNAMVGFQDAFGATSMARKALGFGILGDALWIGAGWLVWARSGKWARAVVAP